MVPGFHHAARDPSSSHHARLASKATQNALSPSLRTPHPGMPHGETKAKRDDHSRMLRFLAEAFNGRKGACLV